MSWFAALLGRSTWKYAAKTRKSERHRILSSLVVVLPGPQLADVEGLPFELGRHGKSKDFPSFEYIDPRCAWAQVPIYGDSDC